MTLALRNGIKLAFAIILGLSLSSCSSIKDAAIGSIGQMFTSTEGSGGNSFTRDDDPELVEDSLPTFLKLLELLRDASPKNPDLYYAVGQVSIMYSGGFLQPKAEQIKSFRERKPQLERAKKFYLRGKDNIVRGLELRHAKNDFAAKFNANQWDELIALTGEKDIPFLYWASLGWLGGLVLDPFDFELLANAYRPILMMLRVLQLEPSYGNGGLQAMLITVLGSLPNSQIEEALNHSPEIIEPFYRQYYADLGIDTNNKRSIVEHHFKLAVQQSQRKDPAPYVAMASWLKSNASRPEDKLAFENYLKQALSIDPNDNIENRLMIILSQRQATYMLSQINNYFL